ncbi:Uncharacterised protein [uncultured archaeon]|nr:Uncharacterised protein [uncultured archaeon]
MVDKSVDQVEKNVSASFGYVKKDMLMVNDAISNLHDKIQHLSMNQAMLVEKVMQLEKSLSEKSSKSKAKAKTSASNSELEFYDVKSKESFKTSDYKIKTIKGRKFAVAFSPAGNKSFRIMGGPSSASRQRSRSSSAGSKVAKKVKSKKTSRTPKKVIKETVLYE